jgi:hypothetical protein
MVRKSVFLGMMLLLGAVLVSLVIRGRKEEMKTASGPLEVVKTAKGTPTRALIPKDLDAGDSTVELATRRHDAPGAAEQSARCQLVIHNRGQIAYHNIVVSLQCVGSKGKSLKPRTQMVAETIQPGQALTIHDLSMDGIPSDATRCTLSVLYANVGTAPPAK